MQNKNMKKIQDAVLENKKVLVRADFNVGIVDGVVQEKFKLNACKETVDHVLSQEGAKVALCSHLGRPEGKKNDSFSLSQLVGDLESILERKVVFAFDCIGEDVASALDNLGEGEVLLLENVRFHGGEEKNDEDFSEKLSANFDAFVNEAFSVCHRDQSSVTGVTKFLPSYAGFWLQKEIENLNKVLENPKRPATAIIGGAKIETKLPLIKKFEQIYDHILVGGKIANEALDQKLEFSDKVILPWDFEGDRLDIGEESAEKFKDIILSSGTVVWNGPLGKFEEAPYDRATREVLGVVAESGAYSLVGGGESVQALEENGLMDKISFVSTGGGAMLEYLSGNEMPGIKALS
ncbi:MAG: Phosphoglycerate kinase [Candidatus Moranbacteria bacterium GW2011_GWE1_49_15]|nr:MAG: Phosphoglycerate kinase [Candidatus Moranbacteria bacterium GW2011_GWE2_47_10]KKW07607.1 MAG: Phosphoglycerate kinase [Candidatus Moranbacteria bacterium GW2011_GWE1_49_15]HBP01059.1 phosphoglycerate kinase [Candidatus Moranbacteria bacterium]